MMIPRLPDHSYSKKLQLDSSAISPTDEQCERILQNVLSATGHTDVSASYTKLLNTLEEISAREKRLRRQARVGAVAAALLLCSGIALLLVLYAPPVDGVLIADDSIPLAQSYDLQSPLPPYEAKAYTPDGQPVEHDLNGALRGLRIDDGVLWFYVHLPHNAQGWRALGAVSGEGEAVTAQVVAGGDVVRYRYPDSGLDILAENAVGERVILEIRSR